MLKRLMAAVFALILSFSIGMHSAVAALDVLEEAPGQVLYQSRQKLEDSYGSTWQAIVFKRVKPDGTASIQLRLVGFPGLVQIERDRPLILTNSLGKTWSAADDSQSMFVDKPEPNVGQYDLKPILREIDPVVPLRWQLPLPNDSSIRLNVPPLVVAEWRSLVEQN